VIKQLKMEAFVASQWIDEWFEAAEKIRDWILEVRIEQIHLYFLRLKRQT